MPEANIQEPEVEVQERPAEGRFARAFRTAFPAKTLGIEHDAFVSRFVPWLHKGGLAVTDQALISGSNFLVSILLARWLAPEQYGAYAVAFGFFLLLSLVYGSLVLEPMAVFGGSTYRNCLRGYLGSLLWMHVAISLAITAIFGVTALTAWKVSPASGLGGAMAGVTIASPCVLLFWLARRTFYLELSPAKSAVGALIYFTLSSSGLFFLFRRGWLSPFSAFTLLGVAALGTSSYLLVLLRAELAHGRIEHGASEIWQRHWRYGRWAILSCVASWIPANIYYSLLSSFGSMAHSGQLKALMNFTLPVEQVKSALGLLFIPYAASVIQREGMSSAGALSRRMTLVAVAIAIAYWTVILVLERPVFGLLYSGRYMELARLLPIVALGSIAWCGSFGSAIALRAMESPASVFLAFTLATVGSLLIGIPATWAFGVSGAIWGTNVSDLLAWVILVWILRRKIAGRSLGIERFALWKAAGSRPLPEELPVE